MKLTKKEALKLHKQMWTDMQNKLGDMPSAPDREMFKMKWWHTLRNKKLWQNS